MRWPLVTPRSTSSWRMSVSSAGPSTARTFELTIAPNALVTGHMASEGPGSPVTQAMFTPCGAQT